jgi:hypothetical protein
LTTRGAVSLLPAGDISMPARYHAVLSALPRDRLTRTSLVDCGMSSTAEAERALDAFAQWFTAIPEVPLGRHHVMLKGSVDKIWHALILHTKLYREFCELHLGYVLEHYPRDDYPPQQWISETVETLVDCFGVELSPLLASWSPSTTARRSAAQVHDAEHRRESNGTVALTYRPGSVRVAG